MGETQAAEGDVRELSERVCSVAHLVSCERSERQALSISLNKEIQSVLDTLDQWRSLRSKDEKFLVEVRSQLEAERCAREVFEDRHAFEVRSINERLDMLSRSAADSLQEQVAGFKTALDDLSTTLQQQQDQQNMHECQEIKASLAKVSERLETMQGRCVSNELILSEHGAQISQIERRITDRLGCASAPKPVFRDGNDGIIGKEPALQPALHKVVDLGTVSAALGTVSDAPLGISPQSIPKECVPRVLAPSSGCQSLRKVHVLPSGQQSVNVCASTPRAGSPKVLTVPHVGPSRLSTPHSPSAPVFCVNRSCSPARRRSCGKE